MADKAKLALGKSNRTKILLEQLENTTIGGLITKVNNLEMDFSNFNQNIEQLNSSISTINQNIEQLNSSILIINQNQNNLILRVEALEQVE